MNLPTAASTAAHRLYFGGAQDKAQTRAQPVALPLLPASGDPVAWLIDTRLQNWSVLLEVRDRCSEKAAAMTAVKTLRKRFEDYRTEQELKITSHVWIVLLFTAGDHFVSAFRTSDSIKSLEKTIKSLSRVPVSVEVQMFFAKIIATAADRFGTQYKEFGGLKIMFETQAGVHSIPPFRPDDHIFFPPQPRIGMFVPSGVVNAPLPDDLSLATNTISTTAEIRPPRERSSSPSMMSVVLPDIIAPEEEPPSPESPLIMLGRRSRSPSPSRLIARPPLDIDRSIEECKIAQKISAVLSEALSGMDAEDLQVHSLLSVLEDSIDQCKRWLRQVAQQMKLIENEGTGLPGHGRMSSEPSPRAHPSILESWRGQNELYAELTKTQDGLTRVLRKWQSLDMLSPTSSWAVPQQERWSSRKATTGHPGAREGSQYSRTPSPTHPPAPSLTPRPMPPPTVMSSRPPPPQDAPVVTNAFVPPPPPPPFSRATNQIAEPIPSVPACRQPALHPIATQAPTLPPLASQPPLQPSFTSPQSAPSWSRPSSPAASSIHEGARTVDGHGVRPSRRPLPQLPSNR